MVNMCKDGKYIQRLMVNLQMLENEMFSSLRILGVSTDQLAF